jgi:hypothetical protein
MNSRRQLRFIYISLTGAWAFSTLAFALLSWAFVRISQLERKQHDLQVYVQALAQRPPKVDVHIGSPIVRVESVDVQLPGLSNKPVLPGLKP